MQGLFVFVVAVLAIAGCAIFGPAERADLSNHMNALEQCQEQARQASIACLATGGDAQECDPKAIAAYKACKSDGGL